MNGILGSFHTNNQVVEVQLFRKFINKQEVCGIEWPSTELSTILKPLMNQSTKDITNCGGLYHHILNSFNSESISLANDNSKRLTPMKEKAFT